MDEHQLVRGMLLRIGRGIPASAPLAKAVTEWAQPHADWLHTGLNNASAELEWDTLLAGVAAARPAGERRPHVLTLADALAGALALESFDATLLALMVACDRLPRVAGLARLAVRHGHDLPTLLGELAGANPLDADRLVRRSALLRLGLIGFGTTRSGEIEVDVRWTLERLLDRAPAAGPDLIDALVGQRQTHSLTLDDFAHVDDVDFLVRLLRGAVAERAPGINILIHGPPGTGKTELARTLAAAAGLALYAIGEADDDDEEPNRWERLHALKITQRLLAGRGGAALLFDEMEDLIGDAQPTSGDWFARREGSKVFVNRLLETNPAPVIWTTNAVGNIDDAILRRMSYALKLDLPSRETALRMLRRVAADERIEPADRFGTLLERAPETATVLRVATRGARLAAENDGGLRAAVSLVRALRGAELPLDGPGDLDLDLFETDRSLEGLFAAVKATDALDVSLLLSGPPGTGKTALAHHLARALDRPLIMKRASDLLSKWVGETEGRIAEAFAEARMLGGVLLLDEVDALLFDRRTARASWEVSQVNELLTWLDRHPLPVVAATNYVDKFDPATLRRFVFKLSLDPLGRTRAARAFERFFRLPAPVGLSELTNLTPGDFAVVARQQRFLPASDALTVLERLAEEAAAKDNSSGPIGFH